MRCVSARRCEISVGWCEIYLSQVIRCCEIYLSQVFMCCEIFQSDVQVLWDTRVRCCEGFQVLWDVSARYDVQYYSFSGQLVFQNSAFSQVSWDVCFYFYFILLYKYFLGGGGGGGGLCDMTISCCEISQPGVVRCVIQMLRAVWFFFIGVPVSRTMPSYKQ